MVRSGGRTMPDLLRRLKRRDSDQWCREDIFYGVSPDRPPMAITQTALNGAVGIRLMSIARRDWTTVSHSL